MIYDKYPNLTTMRTFVVSRTLTINTMYFCPKQHLRNTMHIRKLKILFATYYNLS